MAVPPHWSHVKIYKKRSIAYMRALMAVPPHFIYHPSCVLPQDSTVFKNFLFQVSIHFSDFSSYFQYDSTAIELPISTNSNLLCSNRLSSAYSEVVLTNLRSTNRAFPELYFRLTRAKGPRDSRSVMSAVGVQTKLQKMSDSQRIRAEAKVLRITTLQFCAASKT